MYQFCQGGQGGMLMGGRWWTCYYMGRVGYVEVRAGWGTVCGQSGTCLCVGRVGHVDVWAEWDMFECGQSGIC